MHLHFIFPRWQKLLEAHPDLVDDLEASDIGNFRMVGNGIAAAIGALPAGVTVTMVDEHVEEVDYNVQADAICLSYFTAQAARAHAIADVFRARGQTVISGGIHPSMATEDAMQYADAVVAGPVEGLWETILEDLKNHALKPCYRGNSNAGFANPKRETFAGSGYLQAGVVQISRGCVHGCDFCIVPGAYGSRIVHRPINDVLEDIRTLRFPCFFFGDENLLFPDASNRAYNDELLHRLVEGRNRRLSFAASYPRFIRNYAEKDFVLLRAAGVRQVYLVTGLMQPLRDELADDLTQQALKAAKRAGVEMLTTFTLGHDRDPADAAGMIFDWCARTGTNLAEFTIRVPFPGTAEHTRMEQQGRLLHTDWERYNGAHVVYDPVGQSPADLMELYRTCWQVMYSGMETFDLHTRYIRAFGRGIFEGQELALGKR